MGVIATTTLLGSGVVSLAVGVRAHAYALRTLLLGAALLMAATGVGFAFVTDFWPLLAIAFFGTLNPSSGDVSVFLPLEHSVLSHAADSRKRTAVFANYSLVGSLVAAVGALAAGIPAVMTELTGISSHAAIQGMFLLYAAIGLGVAILYRGLPRADVSEVRARSAPLHKSRARVYTLAALFSLDAFAGGFIVQSMLALWLYQRHGMSAAAVGTIFFCTGILAAVSFLLAVRIASRIGLVNTMVFTHIPANICLIAIAFVDDLYVLIGLLMVRSLLSQMDVPTRSSYVMAIVEPDERPAAASVTTVPRSLASAVGPFVAGYLLGLSTFGWPLVAAGGIKIAYDLMLLAMFRRVRPPEERESKAVPS